MEQWKTPVVNGPLEFIHCLPWLSEQIDFDFSGFAQYKVQKISTWSMGTQT